ncbi:MAG TPA: DUF1684 domain-containing protein [Bryobacteraceae bacterium]|jgi:hypothetical protein|nr:DUF1684 domain-containing protein [Bryobacteraceae bacterium]
MRRAGLAFAAITLIGADSTYQRQIAQWRAEREAKLKADDGWLTVVGLHWLHEGVNTVGSDPNADAPLPSSLPARVGTITLSKGKAHFKPAGGVQLKEMDLKTDVTEQYDRLALGRVKFFVIERETKFGVRVKDNDSEARKKFAGLRWYPVDPSWNIRAKFIPSPHQVSFDTEVGVKEKDESPGYVTFTRGGRDYKMEAVKEDDDLWFVFRDLTSGKTTYGASRFLYTPFPKDGFVEMDFNKAENPPCMFTDYATCPLPTPQNRLQLAVTAGEQTYHRPQ